MPTSTAAESSEAEYPVESISAAFLSPSDGWFYHVQWKGCGREEDTWEPSASFIPGGEWRLDCFWREAGVEAEEQASLPPSSLVLAAPGRTQNLTSDLTGVWSVVLPDDEATTQAADQEPLRSLFHSMTSGGIQTRSGNAVRERVVQDLLNTAYAKIQAWNASCIGTFFCPWVYTAELDKLLVEIYIDFVFLAVVRKAPKGELTGSLERAQMLVMQKCAAAQRRLQGRTELAAPTQVDIFDHGDSDSEASESEDEAIPTARAAAPKKSAWKPQVLPPDDHGRRLFCERLRATVQHFFWDENSCPGLEYYLLEDTRVLKYVSLHPLLATAWLPAIHESGLGLSLHQLTKAASPARRQRADVALSWRVHDWEIAFGAILQRFMDADTMSKATTGVESPKAVPNNVQKFKPKELLLYLGRNINLMALTANPLAALTFAGQDHFAHHWDAWLKETMREAPGIPFDETWDPFAMYRDIVRNPLFRQDDRLRSLGCHDDFIHILQLTSKFRDNSDTIHKETFSHPTLFTMGELDELAALFAPFAIGHDPASESSAAPKATFEDAKRARSDSVQDPAEHFAKRIKTHARNIALAAQTHLGQAPAATTSNKPERQSTSSPFCARDDATGRTVYVAPDTQAHDGGFDAPAGLTGCSICTHLRPREHCLRILYVDSHDVAHLNGCAVTEAPIHDQLPSLKKDIEVKYVHPQDLPPLETIRGRPEILLGRGCGTDTTLIVDRQTLHLVGAIRFNVFSATMLLLLQQIQRLLATERLSRRAILEALGYGSMARDGERQPSGGRLMEGFVPNKRLSASRENIDFIFKIALCCTALDIVSRSLNPDHGRDHRDLAGDLDMSRLSSLVGNLYSCNGYMSSLHLDDDASPRRRETSHPFAGAMLQPTFQSEKSNCKPGEYDFIMARWGVRIETETNALWLFNPQDLHGTCIPSQSSVYAGAISRGQHKSVRRRDAQAAYRRKVVRANRPMRDLYYTAHGAVST